MWGGRRRSYSRTETPLLQRLFRPQPRFPQRRRTPRIVLILAVPALLIFLAIVSGVVLTDPPSPPNGTRSPGGLFELSEAESYPQGALPPALRFDKLYLEKGKRRLTAYSGGKAVRVYLVALGENPKGPKEFEGDKRTPEGEYTIEDKNPKSAYFKNLGISYPNAKDRARAESQGKSPGGNLKIHGLGKEYANLGAAHRVTDWTFGSVAVTNEEMDELFFRTPVGTPIAIVP